MKNLFQILCLGLFSVAAHAQAAPEYPYQTQHYNACAKKLDSVVVSLLGDARVNVSETGDTQQLKYIKCAGDNGLSLRISKQTNPDERVGYSIEVVSVSGGIEVGSDFSAGTGSPIAKEFLTNPDDISKSILQTVDLNCDESENVISFKSNGYPYIDDLNVTKTSDGTTIKIQTSLGGLEGLFTRANIKVCEIKN